jgi:hypothetical protein
LNLCTLPNILDFHHKASLSGEVGPAGAPGGDGLIKQPGGGYLPTQGYVQYKKSFQAPLFMFFYILQKWNYIWRSQPCRRDRRRWFDQAAWRWLPSNTGVRLVLGFADTWSSHEALKLWSCCYKCQCRFPNNTISLSCSSRSVQLPATTTNIPNTQSHVH